MQDLEKCLQQARNSDFALLSPTAFSMDGNVAPLDKIYALAVRYNAMILVDESHSAGVLGRTGRGTTELYDLKGKVEILTGTLGKAFGGAIGGFTTGKREIIEMLRQRSRPYLFSNSSPPMVAAAGIAAFNLLDRDNRLQDKLHENTSYFVKKMQGVAVYMPTQSAICADVYEAPCPGISAALHKRASM